MLLEANFVVFSIFSLQSKLAKQIPKWPKPENNTSGLHLDLVWSVIGDVYDATKTRFRPCKYTREVQQHLWLITLLLTCFPLHAVLIYSNNVLLLVNDRPEKRNAISRYKNANGYITSIFCMQALLRLNDKVSNETKIWWLRTFRYKPLYFHAERWEFWSANKTSFSQISLSRFSKDKQLFVLRFDLCWHKCNPFSFDVKWQVQREKFMKKRSFSVFLPIRSDEHISPGNGPFITHVTQHRKLAAVCRWTIY